MVLADQPLLGRPRSANGARDATRSDRAEQRVLVLPPCEGDIASPSKRAACVQCLGAAAQQLERILASRGPGQRLPWGRRTLARPDQEAADLSGRRQKRSAQHHAGNALRVRARICQCKRSAPRTADHAPALIAQMPANHLHIGDQPIGAVMADAAARPRCAGAALIDQDHALTVQVEQAQRARLAPAARPAMQDDNGLAVARAGHRTGDSIAVPSQPQSRDRYGFVLRRPQWSRFDRCHWIDVIKGACIVGLAMFFQTGCASRAQVARNGRSSTPANK